MNILKLIWKRKVVIIVSTILASLIGFVFSLIISPVYKAIVEIVIQPTDVVYGFSRDTEAISEYLMYQAEIIKSNEVVDNAIDKLHLKITDVINQRRPRESFLKHIRVKPIGSTLIKITAVAKTPQLAAGMASQLANSFRQLRKEESFSISKDAMEWFSKSSKLGKDLKETENKLLNFIKDNDMQNPQQQLNNYQKSADQLIGEKTHLSVGLEENEKILEKLQRLTKEKDTTEIITQRIDPSLRDLLADYRREYETIQSETKQLLRTYKAGHPKIVELNQRKESAIKKVDSRIKELSGGLKEKLDYTKGRISEIEAEMKKGKKEYSGLLDKKREFDLLKTKLENLASLYEVAQQQLRAGGISIVSASIAGFAREGGAPVAKIRPTKIFLRLFTVGGFIIGILITFFLERSRVEKKVPTEPTGGAEGKQM